MSCFKKTLLTFLFIAGLAACGFQPMYGDNGIAAQGSKARPPIHIGGIPDRQGQILRNLLLDRLNNSGRPDYYDYELEFSNVKIDTTEIGIKKDASATRVMLQISVNTKLQQIVGGEKQTVLDITPHAVGAHNVLDNQYASISSREDITEDLLKEIADDIVMQLDLYFSTERAQTQQ